MNVHDYATRQAASDRAAGRGTVGRNLDDVLAEMLEAAGDNAELRTALMAAADALRSRAQTHDDERGTP